MRTSNRSFLNAVSGQRALVSAMANHAIGQLPGGKGQAKRDSVENDRCVNAAAKATAQAATSAIRGRTASEPLSDKQWDMRQIDATPTAPTASTRASPGAWSASSTPRPAAATRPAGQLQPPAEPQLHHRHPKHRRRL